VQAEGWVIDGQTAGSVTNARPLDFLSIRNGSVINGDVTNTIEGEILRVTDGHAIDIRDSRITGTLGNLGRIESLSHHFDGVFIRRSDVGGGIVNSGSIAADFGGIEVLRIDSFKGGIVNSGSIDAGWSGISQIAVRNFAGGLVNSGSIGTGTLQHGIILNDIDNVGSFSGGIVNSGLINVRFWGITLQDVDNFTGGIVNSGSIDGGWDAITMFPVTIVDVSNLRFAGGIVNSGSIDAGRNGISFFIDSFRGGVVNSGVIEAGENGIFGAGGDVEGGVTNSGSIDAERVGFLLWSGHYAGAIVNSGSIDAGWDGLYLRYGIFADGVVNSGSIDAGEYGYVLYDGVNFGDGISIENSDVAGGILNRGSIDARYSGITLFEVDSMRGGAVNSGSIDAELDGIGLENVVTFGGGVVNSGSMDAGRFGIRLEHVGAFGGGIVNSGSIKALEDGVFLEKIEVFDGDIDNSGSISSSRATGIKVSATKLTGAVTNSGEIEAAKHGISVGTSVDGGIWNSGTIKGGLSAINIEDALGAPTVINLSSGAIYGDILLSGTESDTVNVSGGLLVGTIDGTKGPRDDAVNFLLHANTLFFDGSIRGVGRVFVDPGTLIMNGSITDTGTVEVDADTRLVLSEAATIDTEAFTQHPGSTLGFIVGVDGTYGHLSAERANLAGDLQLLFDDGHLYPDCLMFSNLVNWVTRTGTFNPIASESVFLSYQQSYGPNSLSVTQERVPFSAYTRTNNQDAVGAALERGYAYPAPNAEAVAFYAPLFDIRRSVDYLEFLDTASGSTYANALQATINTSQAVNQAVQHRLDQNDGAMAMDMDAERSLWAQALGVWSNADGDRNAAGFDQATSGVAFGFDYQVSDENLVGILGAYLADRIDFEQGGGKSDIDTWQIGAYAQHDTPAWYANGILTSGWNDYDSNRLITSSTERHYADGGYDGTTVALYGEAGYKYPITGGITLKPMLGLGYINVDTDGFTEKGSSPYDLRVKDGSGESFHGNLGVRASLEHATGAGRLVTGEARLVWQHEFLDDHQTVGAAFAATPNTGFEARGSKFGRDSAVVGLGIKVQMANQGELFLNWNGRFGSDYMANSLLAGAQFHW